MQHFGTVWKTRALGLLAIGVGCLPTLAHAETDSVMRVERTPAFDVVLTIGPAQAMSPTTMQPAPSADMATSHNMSTSDNEMTMQPQQADQGMAVNHWIDVHVAQSGSDATVNDVTPTIRIVDKATGEAHDLPSVMGMSGGMTPSDFHYGQNVFLPDGTYQISVLLGPADTAQFRDVVVESSPMMSEPAMSGGHNMGMTDAPSTHP
jgi:hypothetical protein